MVTTELFRYARLISMKRLCSILCSIVLLASLTAAAVGQDAATTQPADEQSDSASTTQPTSQPTSQPATQPAEPEGLAVSFKGMGIEQVADFLSKQMGKPVLLNEDEFMSSVIQARKP